jgi:hypothetical protein
MVLTARTQIQLYGHSVGMSSALYRCLSLGEKVLSRGGPLQKPGETTEIISSGLAWIWLSIGDIGIKTLSPSLDLGYAIRN